jgi:hypothetical protein
MRHMILCSFDWKAQIISAGIDKRASLDLGVPVYYLESVNDLRDIMMNIKLTGSFSPPAIIL